MNEPNDSRLEDVQRLRRGECQDEYEIYLANANDGKGGDITNGGQPLKTYDEWLES